jgi:hypothetical protein
MNLEKSQAPFLCFRPAIEVSFFEKFHFVVNDFFPKNRRIEIENSFFKAFFSQWQKVATKNHCMRARSRGISLKRRELLCFLFS